MQIICECVAILKGFKDISWKTAKGMLADMNFLKNLQEMNCELITVKQVTSCRAHMKVHFNSCDSPLSLLISFPSPLPPENFKDG